MTEILKPKDASYALAEGIQAMAIAKGWGTVDLEDKFIGPKLGVKGRTIRSWKGAPEKRKTIKTPEFMGLIWLIITEGGKDLVWLEKLLRTTDIFSNQDILTLDQLKRYLSKAQIRDTHERNLTEDEINKALKLIFPEKSIESVISKSSLLIEAGKEAKFSPDIQITPEAISNIRKSSKSKKWKTLILSCVDLILLILAAQLLSLPRGLVACSQTVSSVTPSFSQEQGIYSYQAVGTHASLLNNHIRSIKADEHGLWIGYIAEDSDIDQVSYYDHEHMEWTHCGGIYLERGQLINGFAFNSGVVYIATDGSGIFELTRSGVQTYTIKDGLFNNSVYSIDFTGNGDVWAATYDGVFRLVGDHWQEEIRAEPERLKCNHVYQFMSDKLGNLWFAHINCGISSRTPQGVWHSYFADTPSQNVRGILVDRTDDANRVNGVWFATDGGGVLRFLDGQWTNFTDGIGGLLSNNIQDIAMDKFKRIWIATDKGVMYTSNLGKTWLQYSPVNATDIEFGCPSCPFNDGYLAMATNDRGLEIARIPPQTPPLEIVSAPSKVQLKPGEPYVFTVEVKTLVEELQRGDALFALTTDPNSLYNAYPIIEVEKVVKLGEKYIFTNVDNPIIANVPGKYQILWRVWQGGRYVTEPIVVEFEVISN